jgi:hypothetical protein
MSDESLLRDRSCYQVCSYTTISNIMPASERQIELAIEKLKSSPGTFQKLVEQYARFTYPFRFKHIVPLGRDANNVTVRGWPDVYSVTDDFCLCVAEATHSRDWHRHLEKDIRKAETLGKGRFSSFLFVAWDNEPSPLTDQQKINPRYEKLVHFRERLVALDIPPENINFVFRKQLVRTLTQPRFTAVLKELLGLPCHSLPFQLIREARLFGTPDRPEAFAPVEKEYLEGLVHRSSLANEIERRLIATRWAWVRGRGAAGKTVLAIQIAMDYNRRSCPAYYLNLAETDVDLAKVLDALTAYADEQVLFIVDNVHLEEGIARDIFNQWQKVSLGSHLLLVGRDVTMNDVQGRANPLEDLQAEALTLTVESADLAGIYHRLARRFLPDDRTCPSPPREALEHWQLLFGGDLIAFSAAVARRIKQLIHSDWQLQSQDAANYVREIYLDPASEIERINLLRMAALAQLEVDVPAEAINSAGIRRLLKGGLVHRVIRGREGEYEYYHLIHPGLGNLLLTAADYSGEVLNAFLTEQFCYVAQQKPLWGGVIAARLESANRLKEAEAVLKNMIGLNNQRFTGLFISGLTSLRRNCERLVRFGLFSEEKLDQELASEPLALRNGALRTSLYRLVTFLDYAEWKQPKVFRVLRSELTHPETLITLSQTASSMSLHHLTSVLDYAERKLPNLFSALKSELEQPRNLTMLSQTALRAPLSELVTFLAYSERKLPKIFKAIKSQLEQPKNLTTLIQTVLRVPLSELVAFLAYSERKLPKVFKTLQSELEQPRNLTTLSQTTLHTPLNFLVKFLEYTERKLPKVFTALHNELKQPRNLTTLSQAALHTPMGDFVTFINYAEQKLPRVFKTLQSELEQPGNLTTLSQTALHTPLNFLVKFLDYTERKLPKVFSALQNDLEQPENHAMLSQTALHTPLGDLAFFLNYAEHKLPATNEFLNSKLAETESINLIAVTASREKLGNLLNFLRVARIAAKVVAAIDRDDWDRSRLAERSEQPSFFHGLAKELQRLGRPELAEVPAHSLIRTADPQHWHVPTVGLPQVSQVIRLGHAAGREAVLRFLDRIATPAWLEQQYERASSGAIASALFGLWSGCEQEELDYFRVQALSSRLAAEMRWLHQMDSGLLSAALSLLGSAALVGEYVDKSLVIWPQVQQVHEAIHFTAPLAGMTTIGYIQVQFWLGLREMARLRSDSMMVPAMAGEQILELWKGSIGYNDKQQTLNAWMIDWLEQCARSNWVLISDHVNWTYNPDS